ncbi:unnamed protein product [Durusdinium trenchii]|uniref:Neurotransmitter-gated ion-channel ligand-binding domain-containing protein n=1 Tax=Durusdinium trenchii TaxID=1381693 RepID=A0ABP0HKS3_9DINO
MLARRKYATNPCQDKWGDEKVWTQLLDRVMCYAVVSVTSVDAKLGGFQVRMVCRWAFRTSNAYKETEISYRGVPGLRIPGLQVTAQESRIWKDLSQTTDDTITWNGTSIFLLDGYKPYHLQDFPFDRHIISLKHVDFVWRIEKDDDDFFDSMQIVWLTVESKSILPEWNAGESDIMAIQSVIETLDDQTTEVCSKFVIDLRIERAHKFYVRQIFFITCLITVASCTPLAMPLEDMGDRLSVYGGGLLTLVAFKYGVMDHLPSVPYPTFTDSFLMWQIITIVLSTFESLFLWRLSKQYPVTVDWVENGTFFGVAAGWSLVFMIVACCKPRYRTSWDSVKEQEGKDDPSQPLEILPDGFSHGNWTA